MKTWNSLTEIFIQIKIIFNYFIVLKSTQFY